MKRSTRPLSTPGRRPYGTEPGEARTLRSIISRRRRGWTWQRIADLLNARGTLKRNGTPWRQQEVARVASRPADRIR